MSRVLVIGGRGFMGRRVVRLLKQSVAAEVLTAGRDTSNDRRLNVRAPENHSLRGVDVAINAAGPFDYDPQPIIAACRDNGTHYVDLAETAGFIHSARAIGEGSVTAVIPGCSTVPGLIDVFGTSWPGRDMRAQLSIGTNNESSATLLFSMLRPLGRERPHGGRWFEHTWLRDHPGLSPRRYGPYPGGGHEFAFGLDRGVYTLWLKGLAPVLGALSDRQLKFLAAVGNLVAPVMRPFGTKLGILSVDAIEHGEVVGSIEVRAKSNGLDVPSWPSVWVAGELLESPRPATRLNELISPESAITKLREAGYEVLI